MKRFTVLLALAILIAVPAMAERVTPETARKVATTFLNNNGVKSNQLVDLSKAAGFPNLYIFNGNPGFVVMSADDCVKPILGYSLTGVFITEDMPENVHGWLQGYNDEIQYAIENKIRAEAETSKLWEQLAEGKNDVAKATTVIAPLIQTQWNQGTPYNNNCPLLNNKRTVTGCVATAMAQVMKYWNYPSTGIGSHSYFWTKGNQTLSADFGATTYDWSNMTNTYSNSSTNAQKDAVATLMYSCGVSVDMNYDYSENGTSHSGSSAVTAHVADALKTYFNYSSDVRHLSRSSYSDEDWINMLKAELDLSRPIQYHGNGSGGGHSFVCDGYNSDNYFHFNWGWGGYCDDYYLIDNLNPGPGGIGSGTNGIYNDNQGAIFGVHPSTCAASAPTNLTHTLIGLQNLTLNWTAASGAESYNIYRNNTCVGTTTTNFFSETAPFGTNVYWVRSVDANGELSLSSNRVTVTIAYKTPNVDDLSATLSDNSINLSWSAPDWCYPEYESTTLNYGSGNVYYSWKSVHYAHRHLASNLAQYSGKAIYKVSTYIQYPGTYSLRIYTKSKSNNQPDPNSLAASINQVDISSFNIWYEFELSAPIILTGTDDLWVVIKQENTGQEYPTPSFDLTAHNTNAFYAGNSFTNLYDCNSNYNCAWLINTYLTDGTYTYNLYQDGVQIASNLTNTAYSSITLNDNAANQFVVKTNYYGGEARSNMVGFAKGSSVLTSLELASNDKMTLTENAVLSVSGNVVNTNPANLILEDGAQLIHNSANVKATVKKVIEHYTANDNGWYFIASPVIESITPSVDNGLLTNTYDLYIFDQSADLEWKNYRTSFFSTLNHKTGYLYANSGNPTLTLAGTLAANAIPTSLTYDENASFKGFNLIGNPFPCNTTIDKDFYVISGNTVTLADPEAVIAPCEGVIVKATGANQIVTFAKANISKGTNSKEYFDLVITQGKTLIDRARVRLNDGIGMEKLSLDDKHSQISLWQDGQDFAMAYSNGATEMPVSFLASKDGTYTLTLEDGNYDWEYLHLIDNLTGNDIDLLATPSYTFESKVSDYPSRFRLVFSNRENAVDDNVTFAYVNDGNIIINQEGTLQIVDMTGGMIYQGDAKHCVPTSGMTAGVYVLNLITADGVKTQKIVIE